jgi:alkylhydroperoxidase/carboxymuconolactone decarboxylase family protein YurZ
LNQKPVTDSTASDSEKFEVSCDRLSAAAVSFSALEPRMRYLIEVALNASVTHLREDDLQNAMRMAIDAGAEPRELREVLQLVSVLGIHATSLAVPILVDLATDGKSSEYTSEALSLEQENLKAKFIESRGYWADLWEILIRLDPDFFRAYANFSSYPWENGTLLPKEKEFIYIAIDCSTTHLYVSGTRTHMKNAFAHGATIDEVLEVIKICSLLGLKTYDVGSRIIDRLFSDEV